jgi:8-oxo-dGTP diphosphatase
VEITIIVCYIIQYMSHAIHDSETPAKGQQVITACAFIHHKFKGVEKAFLLKRSTNRKFLPGVFEIPGGHIDFGEDIVAGLKREILEETGKEISVGDPFFVFTYLNNVKESHSIEVIYFTVFKEVAHNVTLNPEKHTEYGWISESDISKIIKSGKPEDDPEITAIKKGFSLLKGAYPDFS